VRALARSLPALVFAGALAAFLPATGGGFLNWDDAENLVANSHYRGLGPTELRWIFTAVHMGHYIPVTWLTFALDYLLWGMNPAGYHFTSILIHALNAVLVYLVALRLLALTIPPHPTPLPPGERGWGEGEVPVHLGAALAAFLWALHPLRVESVVWITERRDVVSGFFALAAVLAYLASAHRAGPDGRLHRGFYWTAVGAFVLAAFSKSIVVGLPLVLVALDAYPLRRLPMTRGGLSRGHWWRRALRRALVEKLPFLGVAALAAGTMLAIGFRWGILAPIAAESIPQRLALAAYSLVFYLGKTLWPWPLSPLYSLYRPVDPLAARYLVPGVTVVAVTLVLLALRRRWPAGLAAWVAYVAMLLPASGIFPNGPQIAADRYSYLPGVAWAMVAGAGVPWGWRAWLAGRLSAPVAGAALAAALVLLAGLTMLTERQIGVWRDSVTLWRHAAWADPDSDVPLFYLGWALVEAKRFDEARAHFEASRGRVPAGLSLLRAQFTLHLALVEMQAGRPTEAERRLRETLALDPDHPVAWIRLGTVLWSRGDSGAAERAWSAAADRTPLWARYQVWELRAAVAAIPEASRPARARLAFALAVALQEYRAHVEAEEHYRLAVRLEPSFASAWNNLGVAYATRGRYAEALDAFVNALRASPGERGACANARRAAAALGVRARELDACGLERT
jgi:protein O-mannosyl-transferase